MPAYNEEGCVEKVCLSWLLQLESFPDAELLVVDDGSKDRTGQLLDLLAENEPRLIVFHQANQGHGAALLAAYRQALSRGCGWVFHVDSDDQFLPESIRLLWDRRDASDFILGFRVDRQDAAPRLIITRIARLLNLLLFGVSIQDCNVPFRLIKADLLRKMMAVLPDAVFAPNIFLSVLAAKSGRDLMNIPIPHRNRATGQVSIIRFKLLRVCLRTVRELAEFRLHLAASVKKIAGANA